jgi:hypothetical protein
VSQGTTSVLSGRSETGLTEKKRYRTECRRRNRDRVGIGRELKVILFLVSSFSGVFSILRMELCEVPTWGEYKV